MSVPHTGNLTAEIDGQSYQFNGDTWSGGSAAVRATLNATTAQSPKQHFDIHELALAVLRRAGIKGTIMHWQGDNWDEEIDPGGLD